MKGNRSVFNLSIIIEYFNQQWSSTTTSFRTYISASTGNAEQNATSINQPPSWEEDSVEMLRVRLWAQDQSRNSVQLFHLPPVDMLVRFAMDVDSPLMNLRLLVSQLLSPALLVSPSITEELTLQLSSCKLTPKDSTLTSLSWSYSHWRKERPRRDKSTTQQPRHSRDQLPTTK